MNEPATAIIAPLAERLRATLREDLGSSGDVTSQALVPLERITTAELLVKADGVLCGMSLLAPILEITEELLVADPDARHTPSVKIMKTDSAPVTKGTVVATLIARAQTLLAAERTLLNLICHLSGVATQTQQFTRRIAHTKARILDTRKTMPLWRDLQKHAVRCGGGENHRLGLYDMILIKDNHLALWGARDPAGAVNAARAKFPGLAIEVEVVDLQGLQHVCANAHPEMILLDNFSHEKLREAVKWCDDFFFRADSAQKPLLEASGGVSLETVCAIAETGVDRVSIGALTHSVKALDLSLELFF